MNSFPLREAVVTAIAPHNNLSSPLQHPSAHHSVHPGVSGIGGVGSHHSQMLMYNTIDSLRSANHSADDGESELMGGEVGDDSGGNGVADDVADIAVGGGEAPACRAEISR